MFIEKYLAASSWFG